MSIGGGGVWKESFGQKKGFEKEAGKGMEEKMQNCGRRQEKGDNVQLIFQV